MGLASMTGFSGAEGAAGTHRWRWELRSVNSRGLDVRLRLGQGWDRLEPAVRQRLQQRVARGSVSASLTFEKQAGGGGLTVNEAALETVLQAAVSLSARANLPAPTPEGLLSLRGVLESEDQRVDEVDEELEAAVLRSFDEALEGLIAARLSEGARLREIVEGQLSRIAELAGAAEKAPARQADAIRARLAGQVEALLEATPSLDPQRLHQEAVLLATKADMREELDRLAAHVAAGRELLAEGGAVGRRLDFLAQEFGREANTLCSKSNDVGLTAIGLELKAVVDQLREQVHNIA
ncbi:YicC/YloC family endoribonuclease [Lutibaculum baratangense]|uniref:Protein YicC n=1 Tax=Lutibaculum baratangense AMV1 TaxID=631454 RepID=V4RMH0_9HYPH|nr:YicC/YloC family endoribonuclease [Lutibaculum baratangense]ESR27231.1 Protein YicC [Lutibaculum baratangense AMV1]